MNSDPSEPRADLLAIFRAALSTVEPAGLVRQALAGTLAGCETVPPILAGASRVFVLAVGKAALAMGAAAVAELRPRVVGAVAVAPASVVAERAIAASEPMRIVAGGHPLPDQSSVEAAQAAISMLEQAGGNDLVLVLISGGASAMLVAPAAGISLADKVAVTQALLRARASIKEINAVRKHISAIKGGRLLSCCGGAAVLGLILSDVRGNDLAVIGSGLTAPDPTTFQEARGVLIRHRLWGRAPEPVRSYLEAGQAGEIAESPKHGDAILARTTNLIIGDNARALAGAEREALARRYRVERRREFYGEASEVGRQLAGELCAISKPRSCLIAGGEPVVNVVGKGRGGRAQEMALAAALEIERLAPERRVAMICAGSDGIDGPTDAAGGFADPQTAARARAGGFDPQAELARNNSYPVLQAAGDLLLTGPTGTNVADIFIGLVNF